MPISLYDTTVPSYLQIIGAVEGLVDKAEAWCADEGIAAETPLEARLAPDMFPLAYQIKSVRVHSLGAIEGARRGEFSPDRSTPPASFDACRALLADARTGLAAVTSDELEAMIGAPMRFTIPAANYEVSFTKENFLLSFSLPNFYFHATTAYDIMRGQGVNLGKRDYLGALRVAG